MPVLFPSVTTPVYRLLFRAGFGAAKWSEELWCTAPSLSQTGAIAIGSALAILRNRFLIPTFSLISFEVEQFDPGTGLKNPLFGPYLAKNAAFGLGPGTATALVGDPWTNISIRQADGSGLYHRTVWLRGIPNTLMMFAPSGPGVFVPLGAAGGSFIKYSNIIMNLSPTGASGPGGGATTVPAMTAPPTLATTPVPATLPVPKSVQYLIRGRSKNPLVTLPTSISTAATDATGCYTVLTLANPIAGLTLGQAVHVGGVKGCGLKNINGDTTVVAIAGSTVTINKKNCCCGPLPVTLGKAFLSLVFYNFYPIVQPLNDNMGNISGVSSRKTGRGPRKTRGRRRKKCG